MRHHETGHPLGGLSVAGELDTPTGAACVGSTVTDPAGTFVILPAPRAPEILRQIGQRGVTFEVSIRDTTGWQWRSGDLSGSVAGAVDLAVPLPAVRPTDESWAQFAAHLVELRHTRLHEAIRHLALAPSKESVVGDWAIGLRQSMARALEQAFVDPTGVLTERHAPPTFYEFHTRDQWQAYTREVESPPDTAVSAALDRALALYTSYPAVYQADWELDLDAMAEGNIGVAASKFEDLYNVSTSDSAHAPPAFAKSPLTPYRDYLRALFTGSSSDAESQAKLDQLANRFHQTFKTTDGLSRPANAILADVLKKVLTAPTGDGYGFGFAPAAIEPPGERTHREYADYLIGLTGLSAGELGKRYRLDLGRPDAALSTPVEENIATLQGFYRDGFQSKKDPLPIFEDKLLGKAPFFLYYDEWLRRTGPFYAENLYRLVDTFTCGARPEHRKRALMEASAEDEPWFTKTIDVEDRIAEGHDRMRQGQYRLAIDKYLDAWRLGWAAFLDSVDAYETKTGASDTWANGMADMVTAPAAELRGKTIASERDLEDFVTWLRWGAGYQPDEDPHQPVQMFSWWIEHNIAYRWLALIRLCAFILPACIAEASLASGDYASAVYFFSLGTRKPVGRGPNDIVPPYMYYGASYDDTDDTPYTSGDLYWDGPLPYTIDVSGKPDKGWVPSKHSTIPEGEKHFQQHGSYLASKYHGSVLHEMESRWLRLRQADALIQWADSLYRTDETASIQRAREMYKASLLTVGATAWISPAWGAVGLTFGNGTENPALTAIKGQARKGMLQIDAGLNYYGGDDSLVPHLRYRTLKQAADALAAGAKSAETDLLAYLGKVEDALIEQMVHSAMLAKADLQAQIASEQAEIAKFEVGLAQRQVEAIKAEIEKKKKELEDESGFFEQFKDVIVGMKETIGGFPKEATGFAGAGVEATAGAEGAGLTGSAALAAGSGVMAGYAIFLYAGITSLSNVNDNLTSMKGQIHALENDALPLAEAQVQARQRQVTIADLQRQIAEADAKLARELIYFAQLRFLNVDFWSELAGLTRKTLRRYLALGGRSAWLAERALSYEQDRPLDIVRLDYVPVKFQGITGASQLLSDLAELEMARLEGLRQALCMRRTWSLAFDFPLQFAELKATGRCEFHTSDAFLRLAHPGIYSQRIESVRTRMQDLKGVNPFRGLLRNTGLSTVTRADGKPHMSVRFEDVLPLTEPNPDGWIATPTGNETLGLFEGTGVETTWILELPAAANPYGLKDLADVLFKIEERAQYSPELHDEEVGHPPATVQKYVALSAAHCCPEALAALRNPEVASVTLAFDLSAVGLGATETNRTVTNAFVIVASPGGGAGPVEVKAASQATPVSVPLDEGVAVSNAGSLGKGQPAQPLNALVGLPATQTFTASVTKAQLTDIDLSDVRDVVLAIEYTADLQQ